MVRLFSNHFVQRFEKRGQLINQIFYYVDDLTYLAVLS